MLLLGCIAGLDKGLYGMAAGSMVMAACFGSLYLVGAYDRGREYCLKNRDMTEKARSLKDDKKEEG